MKKIYSIPFKQQIQKLQIHFRPVSLPFIMCFQKDCVYPHPDGKSGLWMGDMERWGSQTSEEVLLTSGKSGVSPCETELVLMALSEHHRVCKCNAHDCSFSLKMT